MEDADTPKPIEERKNKYVYLLIALVGFVLIQMSTPHVVFVDLVFVVVLLATIRAMRGHRTAVYLIIGLVVTFWAASGVRVAFGDHVALFVLDDLLVTVLMTFMALVILGDVVRGSSITTDEIYGAICSYVLIAMGWASLDSAVGLLIPDAFRFPGEAPDLTAAGDGTMVYFSFVTLTTLGYGDIVPVHPLPRALCWMEAAFGQIYLAVLIAKLVSQHQSTRKHS